MHDPQTVAWEIKSPFKRPNSLFPKGYRNTIVTIWHVDPEKDGTDDSCGWFMRERHGDPKMLERIEKAFESDWDRTWTYKPSEDCDAEDGQVEKTYSCGLFHPNGKPHMSVQGIVIQLFFQAAGQYFDKTGNGRNWDKSRRWMQDNLFEIMQFAENPVDSLHDCITMKFGDEAEADSSSDFQRARKRKQRIHAMAATIYGWILRKEQRWWKHPRWHIHHWRIQIHAIQLFKRWAFSRCCKCGHGFTWGYSPVTNNWNSKGPRWFCSEPDVYHSDCNQPASACVAKQETTPAV